MPNPKALPNTPAADDIVWGAQAIGAEVGLTPGQVYYYHSRGSFGSAVWRFSARKLVGSRKRLRDLRLAALDATAPAA
jgi:hypothetical protein